MEDALLPLDPPNQFQVHHGHHLESVVFIFFSSFNLTLVHLDYSNPFLFNLVLILCFSGLCSNQFGTYSLLLWSESCCIALKRCETAISG